MHATQHTECVQGLDGNKHMRTLGFMRQRTCLVPVSVSAAARHSATAVLCTDADRLALLRLKLQ